MPEAPSIKEALELSRSLIEWLLEGRELDDMDQIRIGKWSAACQKADATFQPSGDRREAIALALAEKWPGDYMQGDDECEREPNALAYETADLTLASGLVQNEAGEKVTLLLRMIDAAGGEIDATENVHSLLNYFCDDRGSATDTYNLAIDQGLIGSSFDSMFETSRAWLTDAGRAAIRSARDGGASCG